MPPAQGSEQVFDADVAVIGGGPAGSAIATLLARRGHRVVVLERERFPRFHVGESLLPYNFPFFDELGVRGQIESAGFMRKFGARFCLADGSREKAFRFQAGRFTEFPMSFQVDRARFDEILLRNAAASGAEVREGVSVTGYEVGRDAVRIATREAGGGAGDEAGARASVTARFLVDASGQANFTANREKLREVTPHLRKVAIFAHHAGVELPEGPEQGDIIIYRLDRWWFWFIPLSREKVSVGLVVDHRDARGRDLGEIFEEAVAASPALRERLATSTRVSPLRTMADFSYRNRALVSERLVRVGDAAGFLDPIFSSGVYLAMLAASLAAPGIHDALERGAPMTRSLRRYERGMRRRFATLREMIEGFYEPSFLDILMQPEPIFDLPSAVTALLAGRLDGGWPIRWRLRIFHLLVRLQARFPIVPRLDLPPAPVPSSATP